MQTEQLLPFAGFVIAMTGSPGPNNLMLIAAGANFGFRRSLPHILGIAIGCQVLLLCIALGLSQLFRLYPALAIVLRVLGALFLLTIAYRLLTTRTTDTDQARNIRPFTFLEAALFQWVNPKAWMMFLTAFTSFADPQALLPSTAIIGLTYLLLGMPLNCAWNIGGVWLKDWLQQGRRLLRFNQLMALLLVASLYPLLQA